MYFLNGLTILRKNTNRKRTRSNSIVKMFAQEEEEERESERESERKETFVDSFCPT